MASAIWRGGRPADLGEFQGDRGGIVAVLARAGTVEWDVVWNVDGQVAGRHGRGQGITDRIDQLRGIHPAILGRL